MIPSTSTYNFLLHSDAREIDRFYHCIPVEVPGSFHVSEPQSCTRLPSYTSLSSTRPSLRQTTTLSYTTTAYENSAASIVKLKRFPDLFQFIFSRDFFVKKTQLVSQSSSHRSWQHVPQGTRCKNARLLVSLALKDNLEGNATFVSHYHSFTSITCQSVNVTVRQQDRFLVFRSSSHQQFCQHMWSPYSSSFSFRATELHRVRRLPEISMAMSRLAFSGSENFTDCVARSCVDDSHHDTKYAVTIIISAPVQIATSCFSTPPFLFCSRS